MALVLDTFRTRNFMDTTQQNPTTFFTTRFNYGEFQFNNILFYFDPIKDIPQLLWPFVVFLA